MNEELDYTEFVTVEEVHAHMVVKLIKSGYQLKQEFTPIDCSLLHAGIGICGEAGEIIDTIKKAVIYRQPLDRDNLREELGDLDFYIENLRQLAGLTRHECLQSNIDKLAKRYPDFKYTDDSAKTRVDKI